MNAPILPGWRYFKNSRTYQSGSTDSPRYWPLQFIRLGKVHLKPFYKLEPYQKIFNIVYVWEYIYLRIKTYVYYIYMNTYEFGSKHTYTNTWKIYKRKPRFWIVFLRSDDLSSFWFITKYSAKITSAVIN